MSPRLPGLRHFRNGCSDVSLCGLRGQLVFAPTAKTLTCPECRMKRESPAFMARGAREVAARRKFYGMATAE